MSDESLQARSERLAEHMFIGGPERDFEQVGRHCLGVLLRENLSPSSRVLDVGSGALRAGYWLMRLLDKGHYYGIEPNREMHTVGLEQLVEPEVVERSEPQFDHSDGFDFSVFGEEFDFVLARSIWTHTSKQQIGTMLSSLAETAAPRGKFLASYHPTSAVLSRIQHAPGVQRLFEALPLAEISPLMAKLPMIDNSREYEGDTWVGRSHESDEPGVVQHSLRWISGAASERGLVAQVMPYRIYNDQYWLRVMRENEVHA